MSNFHALVERFHNFREDYLMKEREFFDALKHGQDPHTLVIACCDSRVDPAIILGCRPGEVFVVRSVAALVPPADRAFSADAVMAAVEYGVKHLEVQSIVVMGHSNCGGIRALMSDDWEHHDSEFLDRWLCLAQSARNEVVETLGDQPRETQLRACEESSILLSMENLLTFPWIRERADAGKIEIHGWYFNMNNGEMYYYDTEQERFLLLADHH